MRTNLRQVTKSAIEAASGRLDGFTYLPSWVDRIDKDTLPAFGVATPSERSGFEDKDSLERSASLMVHLARSGGDDIDDQLDLDADAVEAVVYPALESVQDLLFAELSRSEFKINGEGESRIGILSLTFSCSYSTELPG